MHFVGPRWASLSRGDGAMIHDPIYPDAPGHRGSETSILAANDLAPDLGRYQAMALRFIRAAGTNGLTAEELAEAMGVSRTTAQPRTSELKVRQLIKDGGKDLRRRNLSSGKLAIAWVALTPEELAEMTCNRSCQENLAL